MEKKITRIVLTGGPAAGKTTLISRILKELKKEDGWKVITIPETATELISGFGLGPFPDCMTMEEFQYFVIGDQLHKEELALKGAATVPQDKILIIYDRAIFDDRAYISQEDFDKTVASFGKKPEDILAGYDAVIHLVTCAKGAEFAYNYGNAARYESVEEARRMDDRTLEAWSSHPNLYVIDNSIDYEDKINRAMAQIYRIIGQSAPDMQKHKFLIEKPDPDVLTGTYKATVIAMTQTYLLGTESNVERRVRKQEGGNGKLYFYTEKRTADDGSKWVTERPISKREYESLLGGRDAELLPVSKQKYRFIYGDHRLETDIYPFSDEKAILFVYAPKELEVDVPPEIKVIKEVTDDPAYKNRALAKKQSL
ncbi:MAG: AAA family ATPase [Lachnospiraceae bacterium]|nr:AAA family ATPase [Lachnospiraceae bacterium]